MSTLPPLLFADSRQRVLVSILESTRPRPGQTLIAQISPGDGRVEGLRVIPTPGARMTTRESLPDDDVRHLSQLLRAVSRDLREKKEDDRRSPWWHDEESHDPWGRPNAQITRRSGDWRPDTGDLVTVVCREGPAKITPTEILFYWAWRYSEALTGPLQAEVYAVTPEGWAGLAEGAGGSYPALIKESDLDAGDGLPPGLHNAEPDRSGSGGLLLSAPPEALPEAELQECINCYVHRMLSQFTCAGDLRFALHYRDTHAPGAKALESRLRNAGATCDCEIISVTWQRERPRRFGEDHPAGTWLVMDSTDTRVLPWPDCQQGVRRSSQPCGLWRRRQRT